MSNDELDRLAARMRQGLSEAGVIGVSVHSYTPPVIAIACDGAVAAERVKMGMELNAEGAHIEIQPPDLSTILRYF